jgi:DNA-binding NtrC family response regulator
MSIEETGTMNRESRRFEHLPPIPAVLLAHAPPMTTEADGAGIDGSIVIGRGEDCGFRIVDNNISRRHIRIACNNGVNTIEDLGSKNGTIVNGRYIRGEVELPDQAVVRMGMAVLVFLADAKTILEPATENRYGIQGGFHSARLVANLEECVMSSRHFLIAGPSGSGKELAAAAIAKMIEKPLTIQNAARFSSEEEAMTTLFGVGEKIFSDVKERVGFIEESRMGVLFLDEAHNLPARVQKALLRLLEDGELARIGEIKTKKILVNFIFASNEPPPSYGLVKDLLARLRVFSVPPLKERIADIPSIFQHVVEHAFERAGLATPVPDDILDADHYESLMLDGFEETNVRGLMDLADRIATRAATGVPANQVVDDIFKERYGAQYATAADAESAVKNTPTQEMKFSFEIPPKNLAAVEAAYQKHRGNVSAIERDLRENHGINYSRRTIAKILDMLNLPRDKRTK